MARRRGIRGFSLLEMSIALTILSVIAASSLPVMLSARKTKESERTLSRMDEIEASMVAFRLANKRIPCPSDITAGVATSSFGTEAATPGTCTGLSGDGSNAVYGGVPVKALGLPDDYGFDAWGNRIVYHVDKRMTATNATDTYSASNTTPGIFTVYDGASTPAARTAKAVFVLVSPGMNGHGGYQFSGTARKATGSTNTHEQANCKCNTAAAATAYTTSFYQHMGTTSSSDLLDNFDDIVRYRQRAQLDTLVAGGGGSASAAGNTGEVQFNGGGNVFAADDELFWDNTTKRLGVLTNAPVTSLQVKSASDASLAGNGALILGDTAGLNVVLDNNEIIARNNGAPSKLSLAGVENATVNIGDGGYPGKLSVDADPTEGETIPVVFITGGSNTTGDLVVPTTESFDIGHWDLATSTYTQRLLINTAGNAIFGSTTPAAHLQVNRNPTEDRTLFTVGDNYGSTSDDNGIHLYAYSNESNYIDSKVGTNGKTYFRTGHGTENSYARTWMTVDGPTGNVGIGTTTPSVKLDVAGAIRPGDSTTVTTCGAGAASGEGSQRYNYTSHQMEYCNGTTWVAALSGGGFLARGNTSNTTGSHAYTPSLTQAGTLMITTNCVIANGGQLADTSITVDGTQCSANRATNACGWYASCWSGSESSCTLPLSAASHTITASCSGGTISRHTTGFVVFPD